MLALNIAGWGGYIVGTALWLYGYFSSGSASLVDWYSISPTWVSSLMPNMEAELGMLVMCLAMLPITWIAYRQHSTQ